MTSMLVRVALLAGLSGFLLTLLLNILFPIWLILAAVIATTALAMIGRRSRARTS